MKYVSTLTAPSLMFFICLIVNGLLTSCSQQIDTIKPVAETSSGRVDNSAIDSTATLKSAATFPIGVSLDPKLMSNPKVQTIVTTQFNSRTVPIFMNVESVRGQFNFPLMDARVNATDGQSMRLHGHCLVYHIGAPDWLTNFSGSTEDFEKAVKNHIQTIVGRYKGKVKSWDVINEIIDWKTGQISNNAFRKMYANDESYLTFVKRCFVWAHESDPDAKLFWNEDVYEISVLKQNTMIKIINDFKKSGIPINGLGTQLHININTTDEGIRTSLQSLASTGLLIHISELDIAVNPNRDNNLNISSQLLKSQQVKFQTVVNAYKQLITSGQRYGITLWGVGESDSWLVTPTNKRETPLLYDGAYAKKDAFYTFINALKN